MLAIVLISGGMDSAVSLGIAKTLGYDLAALHINYGQKTEAKEQEAFYDLCEHYNIRNRMIVNVSYLARFGGSSLTDSSIEVTEADLRNPDIPSSYVPFRNANILSVATSWAEVIGAGAIIIGAMEEDSSGYPDTRKAFFDAYQETVNLGTRPETNIKIVTPIINMSKKDIILRGYKLGVPFEKTWSCYKNSDKACGKCDSCALRLRGFQEAGIEDPLDYVERPDYTK